MDNELLHIFLPAGILEWFEGEDVASTNLTIRLVLREKNIVPTLPEEHRDKNVVSKGFKEITVDDFPIRGRKAELLLYRRIWQIEGTDILLKRDLEITAPGTKVEKEFAVFLKELDRIGARRYQYRSPGKPSASSDTGGTIQGRVQ